MIMKNLFIMELFFASKSSSIDRNLRIHSRHRLMNKLKPGSVPKIHTSGGPMRLRENVGFFQNAARSYGVNESEVFQAVDCFDKQNFQQVTVRIKSYSCLLHSLFVFRIVSLH